MIYGYARVSTNGQARDGNSLDAQISALQHAGAETIFSDVFSGTKNNRPQLDKLLKVIQTGDTLIITKLDRIARSLIQGIQLLETLSNKGVVIDVLNMGIIDNSPTGKLIRNIMLCFSEFERDMILQRTTEGKAIAKQNANYREGRPKKFKRIQLDHALELLQTHSYKQVSAMTGISVTTIYRAKQQATQTRKRAERIYSYSMSLNDNDTGQSSRLCVRACIIGFSSTETPQPMIPRYR